MNRTTTIAKTARGRRALAILGVAAAAAIIGAVPAVADDDHPADETATVQAQRVFDDHPAGGGDDHPDAVSYDRIG
ncbi:hypothetical protein J1792_03615 [Streptomyces triculaminicus]|uniref:Uncharacterized protein n=2 Tax=Streptomyces TaxID=1883 RepID=A0A939JPV5_9ACTN|nr:MULTISPECIES: hypothetical protein [Streptomyces]MBO0651914.1 hypothetical protein [Streptomyces triculaminicus]QSY47169.1 hypothetical protein J3S04_17470 [Streptomyces griseocarneus]